jgi:hypothetical protein
MNKGSSPFLEWIGSSGTEERFPQMTGRRLGAVAGDNTA